MLFRPRYGNNDFTDKMLPGTRGQQFFSFLKNEKLTLLKIGLVLFLFSLPFLVVASARFIYINYVSENPNLGDVNISITIYNMIFNGFGILAYMVFSLGLFGALRIIKNLVWNEGVLFWSDFGRGLRTSFLRALLFGFAFGLVVFLNKTCFDFAFRLGNELCVYLLILCAGISVLFVFPILFHILSQETFYNNSIILSINNATSLSFAKYWVGALFSLGLYGLLAAYFLCPSLFYFFVVDIVVVILLLPYLLTGWHCFALSLYDVHFNGEFPEFLFKGLKK